MGLILKVEVDHVHGQQRIAEMVIMTAIKYLNLIGGRLSFSPDCSSGSLLPLYSSDSESDIPFPSSFLALIARHILNHKRRRLILKNKLEELVGKVEIGGEMRIQCDVCEKAPATVICCADEAALCAKCDLEVHAANKLASKHQRLRLECLSTNLPKCDICQDRTAYIFCVEDRALLCRHCDEPIHSAGTLSANHQRFLATGIPVALSSDCRVDKQKTSIEPPNQKIQLQSRKMTKHQASTFASPWSADDVLQFSDFKSSAEKGSFELGELDWLGDMGLLGEQIPREGEGVAAAEVPEISVSQSSFGIFNRPKIGCPPNKKPRIEIKEDHREHITVPDLG